MGEDGSGWGGCNTGMSSAVVAVTGKSGEAPRRRWAATWRDESAGHSVGAAVLHYQAMGRAALRIVTTAFTALLGLCGTTVPCESPKTWHSLQIEITPGCSREESVG